MSSTRGKTATKEQPAEEILLGTRDGGNVLVSGKDGPGLKSGEQAGGRLYTDDMPAIEDLLARYEVVTAVIHKPVPIVSSSREASEIKSEVSKSTQVSDQRIAPGENKPPAFIPVLLLGGLPAATFAAGLVMLAGALVGGAAVTNAYIGLLLFFGGLGLGVVAKIALNEETDS
jgi:hypothetical protein